MTTTPEPGRAFVERRNTVRELCQHGLDPDSCEHYPTCKALPVSGGDTELRDRIAQSIGIYNPVWSGEDFGTALSYREADAALSVVTPELERLRAESERQRIALADALRLTRSLTMDNFASKFFAERVPRHRLNLALWLHAEARAEVEQLRRQREQSLEINEGWARWLERVKGWRRGLIRERDAARAEVKQLRTLLDVLAGSIDERDARIAKALSTNPSNGAIDKAVDLWVTAREEVAAHKIRPAIDALIDALGIRAALTEGTDR